MFPAPGSQVAGPLAFDRVCWVEEAFGDRASRSWGCWILSLDGGRTWARNVTGRGRGG
jgi:hypothetical protein